MTTSYKTDAEILDLYNTALTNAENQPEIAAAMAEFGYSPEMLAEGRQILVSTRNAYNFNKKEDDETVDARVDYKARKKALYQTFKRDRKKARIVFRNDVVTLSQLGVIKSIPHSYVSWVDTMKFFYNIVVDNASIAGKLARLKLTADAATATLADIEAMESARKLYYREMGESQEATQAKDAAFAVIDDWMTDFYDVAIIALEDKPQLLEALGVLVRS
ncbi:hypothetical protein [Prolixibacter sp. NT017]|uniref:hypothetical protein n=1 Tax=Prolixibacter sp. NT017 TaxID=2652390 RepID=UPI001271B6B9|nr:hypothetical protein [Prolixibacter sp. NT017]GET24893.1 hypothetical protein NT017_12220 [Prolixibacter sp. NT017]